MKKQFRLVTQQLRHLAWIERADWIWNSVRQALLRVGGNGVPVCVGGVCEVQMPPEYAGGSWENYEPAVISALADWVHQHPDGNVLDIGCASISIVCFGARARDRL